MADSPIVLVISVRPRLKVQSVSGLLWDVASIPDAGILREKHDLPAMLRGNVPTSFLGGKVARERPV
jgi:hypothetical protein